MVVSLPFFVLLGSGGGGKDDDGAHQVTFPHFLHRVHLFRF